MFLQFQHVDNLELLWNLCRELVVLFPLLCWLDEHCKNTNSKYQSTLFLLLFSLCCIRIPTVCISITQITTLYKIVIISTIENNIIQFCCFRISFENVVLSIAFNQKNTIYHKLCRIAHQICNADIVVIHGLKLSSPLFCFKWSLAAVVSNNYNYG